MLIQPLQDHGHHMSYTPCMPSVLHHTPIKKRDAQDIGNYRRITLASVIYKLWASCLTILATDSEESHKIINLKQDEFRAKRSCPRTITIIGLCTLLQTEYLDVLPRLQGSFPFNVPKPTRPQSLLHRAPRRHHHHCLQPLSGSNNQLPYSTRSYREVPVIRGISKITHSPPFFATLWWNLSSDI